MADRKLAFDGAQGYGAETSGGRGGAVVHVTNLNDSGAGSLRWALETVSGARTVVFDVNGSITLKSQILVTSGDVTIAGQSAAGEGITIEGSRIRVDASNVIVRGLHFRPGDGSTGMIADDRDGMFIGSTTKTLNNIMIDHNSFEWAIDENVAASGRVQNITFSNNIIAQGLSESIHSKGEHSKGTGTGNWTTGDYNANNHISWVTNLIADNQMRNAEIGTGAAIEMINNYIFNPGMGDRVTLIGGTSAGTKQTVQANLVGNVYEAGLDTTAAKRGPVFMMGLGDGSSLYLEDNLLVGKATDAAGNQDQSTLVWSNQGTTRYVTTKQTFESNTGVMDSQDVVDYVLANAGAGGRYARDAIDQKLIAAVGDKTSRIIDSVAEGGGQAKNPLVAAVADTDRDGMVDWFEDLYGFDTKAADNNGDADGDGYSNVEEYLNGLIDGFDLPTAKTGARVAHDAQGALKIGGSLDGLKIITGFDSAGGDRLDLSAILKAYPDATVQVAPAMNNSYVTVDPDGTGNGPARLVAIIEGKRFSSVGDVVGTAQPEVTPSPPAPSTPTPPVVVTPPTPPAPAPVVTPPVEAGTKPSPPTPTPTPTPSEFGDGVTVSKGVLFATKDATMAASYASLAVTGSGDISVTGNGLDNVIRGGNGSNRIFGEDGNDRIIGGASQDFLYGGNGNDRLDGAAGANMLYGGTGNDFYTIMSASDSVIENAGEGYDTVDASISYTLASNVEALALVGTAVAGTGNALDNRLTGNAFDNVLTGLGGNDQLRGGAGNDTLYGGGGDDRLDGGVGNDLMGGGAGNDIYQVDASGDVVNEGANEGLDTVNSSVSYMLRANVENLALTGTAGLNGTGNALDNKLIGNSGANVLSGGEGNDMIIAGDGADCVYGDAGNDRLDGGTGNDLLIGGGGVDVLIGGAGNDIFRFGKGDSSAAANSIDQVLDFMRGQDKIDLDVVSGKLSVADFETSYVVNASYASALGTANDLMKGGTKDVVFVANKTDAWLFWDTDGNHTTADAAILLKGMGAASAAAFASAPFDASWIV